MRRGVLVALVVFLTAVRPAPSRADDNDLVISRLSTRTTDGTGALIGVVGQSHELRALASQLGVVLAPHLLTPADTVGFGGFQLTVDYSSTTIDADASYWKAREASPDPTGAAGSSHG